MRITTKENERLMLYQQNLPLIVLLQAQIRGFLVRKDMNDRLHYFNEHTKEATIIQVD